MPNYSEMDNLFFGVPLRTFGRRPKPRMLAEEKITKKRLGNPALWAQLDAVSRDTWVNHLGEGHRRVR